MNREADQGLERLAAGQYRVVGDMTFETVPRLYRAAAEMFRDNGGRLHIDFSSVGRADSAGVALLTEWMRSAHAAGKSIRFHCVPAQLCAIARVGGVASILPLDEEPA